MLSRFAAIPRIPRRPRPLRRSPDMSHHADDLRRHHADAGHARTRCAAGIGGGQLLIFPASIPSRARARPPRSAIQRSGSRRVQSPAEPGLRAARRRLDASAARFTPLSGALTPIWSGRHRRPICAAPAPTWASSGSSSRPTICRARPHELSRLQASRRDRHIHDLALALAPMRRVLASCSRRAAAGHAGADLRRRDPRRPRLRRSGRRTLYRRRRRQGYRSPRWRRASARERQEIDARGLAFAPAYHMLSWRTRA